MATLFNTKISATYEGLFKTIDNAAITASLKELTDGSGNQSGLYVNTAGDFKVSNILEWGSLKDTGTGVTITRYVTSTDGIENFDNNTSLPTSAAVKLYVDSKFATSDTLQEVLSFGNTTGGNDIVVSASDDITFTDSSKILMGAGSDLQIYHDGSNSFIEDLGTGSLRVSANAFRIYNAAKSEFLATFNEGGAVELYYNNSTKFITTSTGAEVTGNLVVTGTITGSGGSFLPLAGGTMTGNILLNDNVKTIYGTGNDLEIYHDGNNSRIVDNGTGELRLQGTNLRLWASNGENYLTAIEGGAVSLYFNAAKMLETTSTGVAVTGALSTTTNVTVGANATFVDNGKAIFGAGSDLQIYHDGSHSKIEDLGTGDLKLITDGAKINLQKGSSENLASFIVDGANEFYYDAIKRLETVTDGAKVTGNLEVTGTITGSGGSFLPLAGGTMTGNTIHNDNVKSIYGTASDGLEIYHDSSNSYIRDTGTGNLWIQGSTQVNIGGANGEIGLQFVENAGVGLRHNNVQKLTTSSTGISVTGDGVFTGNVNIPDAGKLQLGSNLDLLVYHNGNDAIVRNYTGGYFIDQAAVTQSITFRVSNANSLDTTALIISRNGDLTTGRDVTIAGDLTVNGTTTTVNSQTLAVVDPLIQLAKDNTANSLDIGLYGDYNDGTGRYLGLFSDASDGNKFKLFKGTTVEPTTTVNIGGAGYVAADLQVAGLEATNFVSTDITIADYIYHASDANTYFGFPANDRFEVSAGGNINLALISNGVTLAHTGDTKLITTTSGVTITGGWVTDGVSVAQANVEFTDNSKAMFGNGNDFQIYHDGSNSYIAEIGTGELRINSDNSVRIRKHDNETMALFTANGAAELYYDNSKKFETTSTGVTVTGDGTITGIIRTNQLLWGNSYSQGVLSWDTGYALIQGQSGNGIKFQPNSTTALTLDTSANATFAGNVAIQSTIPKLSFTDLQQDDWDIINDNGEFKFLCSTGSGVALQLNTNNNATFAGDVTVNGWIKGASDTNTLYSATALGTLLQSPTNSGAGANIYFRNFNGTVFQTFSQLDGSATFAGNVDASTANLTGSLNIDSVLPTIKLTDTDTSAYARIRASNGGLLFEADEDNTQADSNIRFEIDADEKMRIDSSGRVGIGTDSPDHILCIEDTEPTFRIFDAANTLNQEQTISFGTEPGNRTHAEISGVNLNTGNAEGGLIFKTNSGSSLTERMRITSGGVVEIGTSTAQTNSKLDVRNNGSAIEFGHTNNNDWYYGTLGAYGSAGNPFISFSTFCEQNDNRWTTQGSPGNIISNDNGNLVFQQITSTNSTAQAAVERMRITTGGDVLIGTDSTTVGGVAGHKLVIDTTSQNLGIITASGSHQAVRFANGSTAVGSINLTTSSTTYNTSSDYRLKEDLQDFAGLDMVSKIPVYDFKWKTDENRSYGVMAHELQEVLPQAVVGEKDAEEMQSVDYSKIVPLLVKSIQELTAKVDKLEQECKCKN